MVSEPLFSIKAGWSEGEVNWDGEESFLQLVITKTAMMISVTLVIRRIARIIS
jgi:hypothetical protein